MSSFYCEYCGEAIIDTPKGYVTACKHFPNKRMTPSEYDDHKRWLGTLKTLDEQRGQADEA